MANIREVERLRTLLLELQRSRPVRDPLASSAEEQLSTPQLHALMWLGHDGPLTMGELARRLCITEKGVTGIGDKLENYKYCDRVRIDDDRRVVRLKLTPLGEEHYAQAQVRFNEKLITLLDALGTKDRSALFRILQKLREYFEKLESPNTKQESTRRRERLQ